MICWCGNGELQPFSDAYAECRVCGTLVSRQPADLEINPCENDQSAFYGREYWLSHQELELKQPDILRRSRSDLPERCVHWLRALLKYVLPPAQVLELGSGPGTFVAMMRWAGFDATGLELSPWVVEYSQHAFGIPVLTGPVENQDIEPESVDAIAMMDVLEHLPNPVETVRHCIRLLKPSGALFIQTPRFPRGKSYEQLVQEGDRFLELLQPAEHIYLFSDDSVRRLFRQLGWNEVASEPAIFAHYDMFRVVSRVPLPRHAAPQIERALAATSGGRLIQALLDEHDNLRQTRQKMDELEADRAARLEVIRTQGDELGRVEADRNTLAAQLEDVRTQFKQAETDRAARLEIIHSQEHDLQNVIQERDALSARLAATEQNSSVAVAGSITNGSPGPAAARAGSVSTRGLPGWRARLFWKGAESNPAESKSAEAEPDPEAVAQLMARKYAHDPSLFRLWESHGFHVLPVHFYSPVPQLANLPSDLWSAPSLLPGIDVHEQDQISLLHDFRSHFKDEYDAFPREPTHGTGPVGFYINQPMFTSVDAEVLYCMLRHFKPSQVVEVGSGFSTLVSAQARSKNASEEHPFKLTSIEPYPPNFLESVEIPEWSLIRKPVQEIGLDEFSRLRANDVLFIDSSHVVKVGSDVLYLLLEVVPRLRAGVIVHVHDIFLPFDYPSVWVHDEHRFWSEQYLLQAFLAFNQNFEILWAGSYMRDRHPDLLSAAFASFSPGVWPGSLWMRHRSA